MIGKNDRMRIKKWLADALVNRKKEITSPDGTPYVNKMKRLIKTELAMDVTRQTLATYMKEELSGYLDIAKTEYCEEMREYDDMMSSAKNIWNNEEYKPLERTKAYNSWLRAKKQREELERKLQVERIAQAEVQKPTYLISFKPGGALRECPNCGHKYFDNVKKVESDVKETDDND